MTERGRPPRGQVKFQWSLVIVGIVTTGTAIARLMFANGGTTSSSESLTSTLISVGAVVLVGAAFCISLSRREAGRLSTLRTRFPRALIFSIMNVRDTVDAFADAAEELGIRKSRIGQLAGISVVFSGETLSIFRGGRNPKLAYEFPMSGVRTVVPQPAGTPLNRWTTICVGFASPNGRAAIYLAPSREALGVWPLSSSATLNVLNQVQSFIAARHPKPASEIS
jgi:hypothetical protein